MLVSVAIVCRNDEASLAACLDSCLAQTYEYHEIVVVDAGSSDGSRRIIEDYQRRLPERVRGHFLDAPVDLASAGWHAIQRSRGEFVALACGADISLPHRLAAGVDILNGNPALGAVFSCLANFQDNDSATPGGDNPRWQILAGLRPYPGSLLARGEILRALPPNAALAYAADLERWLRLLDKHEIYRERKPWVRCQAPSESPRAELFAQHYEDAVCIIDALRRWPLGKLFHLGAGEGPAGERERAQCEARLAEFCLERDVICFGHPHLYTAEAYRRLLVSLRLDPENALARHLLPEVWRRLGDAPRAMGQTPLALESWKIAQVSPILHPPAPLAPETAALRAWQAKAALREIDGLYLARRQHAWSRPPRFVIAVDAADPTALAATFESLKDQFYPQWVVAALGGTCAVCDERLHTFAAGTAADALLQALARTGDEDWLLILPTGTRLEAHALHSLADATHLRPQWQAIYADDASPDGIPRFKPDFDPVLLAGTDYLGPVALPAPLVAALAPATPPSPGLAHALVRQIATTAGEPFVGHIADILATVPTGAGAPDAVRDACTETLLGQRVGRVRQLAGAQANTRWILPEPHEWPSVSLVAVGNSAQELTAATAYTGLRLAPPVAAGGAALTEALSGQPEDILLIVSGDFRPTSAEWLQVLVATLHGWGAALAAPAVIDSSGRLENAGYALGIGGSLGPVFSGTPFGDAGDSLCRAALPRRVGAVDAACLLVSRGALLAAGGLDPAAPSLAASLADACARLVAAGNPPLWTPLACLIRQRSPSPAPAADPGPFVARWLPQLAADPSWNRNLSLVDGRGMAETDLVARWQPTRRDALRILALPLPPSGQAEYRVSAPLRALDDLGLAQTASACEPHPGRERAPTPVELARLAPDVLYAQAIIDDVRLQGYLAASQFNPGIFRIFSLDDRISDVPVYNDAHRALRPEAVAERMALALAHSDRLIVSTAPLAELYRAHVADIRVVPNRLETGLWEAAAALPRSPRRNDRPRVGWAGALQHAGDLALIAPVVEALAEEVDWIFFGMIPTGCERHVAEFHPPVRPFSAYPARLASLDLDLALAPLEINLFNESKSNLRLLEYGIFGWPVIASDVLPYRENDAPVCRVPNTAEAWMAAIRQRLADPGARRAEGRALEAWVRRHYLLEAHAEEWLAALTPSIRRRPPSPSPPRQPIAARSPHAAPNDGAPAEAEGGWPMGARDARPRILAASQTTLTHDYRAASPLRALREAGLAHTLLFGSREAGRVLWLSPEEIAALDPDFTYWNFIVDDLRLAEGLARCARDFPSLPRIYGLDDRIGDLPNSHPLAGTFQGPQLDRRVREALALCQRLVVSTEPLAELYGPHVESVCIVPNRLEAALWRDITAPSSSLNRRPRLRVGWAGAAQHAADLALLQPVIAELADSVDWVFFGMAPAGCEVWIREIHPPVAFRDYPARLAALDLDIALAPLEINLFNEAKSNLRLLDYGWLGWPVIATDILPYRSDNPPVLRVSNQPKAWVEAIRALVGDPDARRRLGAELAAWVRARYVLEDHLDEWREALAPR